MGERMMVRPNFDFQRHAYGQMQLIRALETKATEMTTGADPAIVGSIHLCAGQEAIPVGALAALREDDRIIATYRGHGWALEAGVSPFEALAEMCHRQGGINGGRAGSPMMMAPDRGFIGENSIVGAGGPIACGVAIAAKVQRSGRVALVSFGDGATSQGGLHEAFTMAAAQQLPVIFVCENNEWAEMTPTSYAVRSSIAARAAMYGMAGEQVDGCDPTAVKDAVARAAERARNGEGPTLLECHTIRLWGHYNRDIEHYRSKKNRVAAADRDPIVRLRTSLLAGGMTAQDLDAIDAEMTNVVEQAAVQALASPRPSLDTVNDNLFAASGKSVSDNGGSVETMTYAQAINRAFHDEMAARDDVILLGEDVGKPGGVFGLSRGLQKAFGPERVIDTPIAETAILGAAVGAAMSGLRPIAEIMFADFLFVGLDQIINQAANVRYVSNGRASAPLVVRTQQGITPGSCAQHGQCVEAHLANIPGIKVGLPITPQEAYAMLRAAVADPDPCVIIEARSAFGRSGEVLVGGAIEPAAGARLRIDGDDAAIITWGTSVYPAIEAAEQLAAEGISVAVLDLRWLSPIDDAAIAEVVARTGRILIVHEASKTGGFGAEIAARIAEHHGASLAMPARRLGGLDVRMPASPALQQAVVPGSDQIAAIVRDMAGNTKSASQTRAA
jgi:2-oxoisovalerate dehydrogenase E1 component